MVISIKLYTVLIVVMKALSLAGSDVLYNCPSSPYDCRSLELSLRSTADEFITPEFMASYHDPTSVDQICRFFRSPTCYEPVVRDCKGELKFASRAFRDRQRYICGDRVARRGRNSLKICVDLWGGNLETCKVSRSQRLVELENMGKSPAQSQVWCSVTKEYITCVYSVFALGCTFEVADEYMASVNKSTPVVEAVYGHECNFGHPLDILKTTTPVPETSPAGHGLGGSVYSSGRHPNSGSSRSSASALHNVTVSGSPSHLVGLLLLYWAVPCSPLDNLMLSVHKMLALVCNVLSVALQTFLARVFGNYTSGQQKLNKNRKCGRQR